ncbi:hypothetical protein OTU49_015606, partial [Cherax quadricarinatus]
QEDQDATLDHDATILQPQEATIQQDQNATIQQELEDVYGGVISAEQLALLDHQANPFNFSERVSQTMRPHFTEVGMQTEPAPSTTFRANVGFFEIHDAYRQHQQEVLTLRNLKKVQQGKINKDAKGGKQCDSVAQRQKREGELSRQPVVCSRDRSDCSLAGLLPLLQVLERMVSQNLYQDVIQ